MYVAKVPEVLQGSVFHVWSIIQEAMHPIIDNVVRHFFTLTQTLHRLTAQMTSMDSYVVVELGVCG